MATKTPRTGNGWEPLLRRADQGCLGTVVAVSLLAIGGYCAWQWREQGGLIDIEQVEKRQVTFQVDINRADWCARASGKLLETVVFRAAELGPVQFDHRIAPAIAAGERFLREYLASGPKPTVQVIEAAGRAGIRESSLRRAATRLGLRTTRGSKCAKATWALAGAA